MRSTLRAVPAKGDCPPFPGPPAPHYLGSPLAGTTYLNQKRAELDSRRQMRASVRETIENVEQSLAGEAEHCCRVRNLPSGLTGRSAEMVFNAAFLLPSSTQASWLETAQRICRDVRSRGLVLEVSGPWPPYHFCPSLEL